ncbi:hypothetical protein PHMEG_00035955, partial [Phytophthora megakarya]
MIAGGVIPPLLPLLQEADDIIKQNAAVVFVDLATGSDKSAIRTAGGIPPLVNLLRNGNAGQKGNVTIALAIMTLDYENRMAIANAGGIPPLVAMLHEGNDMHKEKAAAALVNLATVLTNKPLIGEAAQKQLAVFGLSYMSASNETNRSEMINQNAALVLADLSASPNKSAIRMAGGIPLLVGLLRNGTAGQKGNVATALARLAAEYDSRNVITDTGAIPVFVEMLRNGVGTLRWKAAWALVNLSLAFKNKQTIAEAGAIPSLVEFVRDGNDLEKEYAALALGNLAIDDMNKGIITRANAIPPLQALAQN